VNAVGVDVGGTKIAAGIVNPEGEILDEVRYPTPQSPALSVLEAAGMWLGVALAGFVNVFNPEVVVVGGGAVEAGELILKATRREVMLRARPPSRDLAEVKAATLGPKSGVLGAAALARDVFSDGYVLGG
jgi:glucokinase